MQSHHPPKSFSDMVREDQFVDIAAMDTNVQGVPLLSQLLGDLMSYSYPKLPLFISTDQTFYEDQGIVFQFIPHLVD